MSLDDAWHAQRSQNVGTAVHGRTSSVPKMRTTDRRYAAATARWTGCPCAWDPSSPGRNADVEAFSYVHPFHAGRRLFCAGPTRRASLNAKTHDAMGSWIWTYAAELSYAAHMTARERVANPPPPSWAARATRVAGLRKVVKCARRVAKGKASGSSRADASSSASYFNGG